MAPSRGGGLHCNGDFLTVLWSPTRRGIIIPIHRSSADCVSQLLAGGRQKSEEVII